MNKISLPNVTLFCISSNNIPGALYALQKSMEGISFGKVKLITHEYPGNLPEGIEFSKCYKIESIHDYNYYCIYNLTKHIDTDYCLLVQPDGYVIRPWNWDNTRSKKLLDVPTKVQVPWDVNKGNFYKHFGYGSTSEDGNICVHNRHIYEEQGCKFAPIEVAAKFSKERHISPYHDGIETFGFHFFVQDII